MQLLKSKLKYPTNYYIFSCHTSASSVYDNEEMIEKIHRQIHRQIQGLEQDQRPKFGNGSLN